MRALALIALACCAFAADDGVSFAIVDAHGVSTRDLRAAAQRDLDAYRESPHAGALHDAAWAMESALRRKGYIDARVSFVAEPDAAHARRVEFRVDSGPKAEIDDVAFTGVRHFRARDLTPLVMRRTGLLDFGDPPYVPGDVDESLRAIERKYLLAGFYRVRVSLAATTFSGDRRRVKLTIAVDEGPLYHVRAAEVELPPDADPPAGFDAASQRATRELIGKPYRARLGEEKAAQLRAWLRDHGRLRATVTAETAIDEAQATASIRLRVDPAREVRLRRVDIELTQGRTRPAFVRGVIRLGTGQPWDQSRVDDAVRNLYQAGIFSKIDAEPVEVPGHPDQADLRVRLEEVKQPSELDYRLGWGSYEMLRGGLAYRDRDLFGWGRFLEADADISMKSYGGSVTLRDRYAFGPRNEASLTPYYLERDEPSFIRHEVGADAQVKHTFVAPWTATVGHRYRATRASSIEGAIPDAESAQFEVVSEEFVDLTWDERDNRVDPRSGWILDGEVSFSDPIFGADLSYLGYRAAAAGFLPLTASLTGALDLRYESRRPLDGRDTLPIQERVFLGGATTVRSFGQDELGPVGEDGEPAGGLSRGMASAELRQRLPHHFAVAAFYDIGELGEQVDRLQGPPGQAIGGGVRYLLPIGPLRLDAAWNPGARWAAKRAWAIQFAVGFSF